jgi:membrane protein implicated in regulation of membrane protease activity
LRAISCVAAPCSSTAAAIELAISLTRLIVVPIAAIAWTELPVVDWIALICVVISSVALAVCVARFLTSAATTAKPLPASPARAASMVALRASRLAVQRCR